jgi:hypothetical protein
VGYGTPPTATASTEPLENTYWKLASHDSDFRTAVERRLMRGRSATPLHCKRRQR